MKYDIHQKPSKFAERVLADFSATLFRLLQGKNLESITVNELCEQARYPRATFYNYFDDIYDLLDYAWIRVKEAIRVGDYREMEPSERTGILFGRCYDYLEGRKEMISRLMRFNLEDGRFMESLRKTMRDYFYEIIINTPCACEYTLPYELIAEHCANTIQTVLEWCFIRKERLTKEQALEAVRLLLG